MPSEGRIVAQRWDAGAALAQLANRPPTRAPVGPPDQNWSPLLLLGSDQRQVPLVVIELAPSQTGAVRNLVIASLSSRESMRRSVSPLAEHADCAVDSDPPPADAPPSMTPPSGRVTGGNDAHTQYE